MIFLQKRHNYVTVQRIFNRFSQNQITISWHIHLRIFAESLIKFVQKLREIYGKTNVGLSLFFWTRCRRPSCQHHNKVWKLCGQSWLSLSSDSAITAAFNSLLSVFFTRSIVSRALGRTCQHSRISRLNDSISCNHTSTYDTSASPVTSSRR